MMRTTDLLRATTLLLTLGAVAIAAPKKGAKDADFAIQGEYTGTLKGDEGDFKLGVQVIALGDGKFRGVGHPGGLPGDGFDKSKDKEQVEAEKNDDGSVTFKGEHGSGTAKDGVMKIVDNDGNHIGDLKRVIRKSSTLGKKPPQGATVLFDGKNADNFKPGKITKDGLLEQGANSKQRFGSHTLHIEFRLPYMPTARGQGRGNSGCYLQGRYEVQMLDSFGLAGKHNECGGIYTIKEPSVNMCYPPMSWQTYDIEFTEAVFKDGKKVKDARITVLHNGVKIHDNVALTHRTTGSPLAEGSGPGFLHLQNHGNPVRYRNIWVVEKK